MAATNFRGFQVGFGQITDRVANWASPDESQGYSQLWSDRGSPHQLGLKGAFFYDGYYFYHVGLISFI